MTRKDEIVKCIGSALRNLNEPQEAKYWLEFAMKSLDEVIADLNK